METKNNESVIISSVDELRPSLRIKVKKSAHLIGFLTALVVVLGLFAFDIYPMFFLNKDWLLMIAIPLWFYCMGYLLGWNLALWDLGYVLGGVYSSKGLSSEQGSNDSSTAYHGCSYSSSVSINPSSGHPMSGSSGIDTYGNPYGTRSW